MLGTILGRRPPEYQARPRYQWRVCTKVTVACVATYLSCRACLSEYYESPRLFYRKAGVGVASDRGDTVLCIGKIESARYLSLRACLVEDRHITMESLS